MRVKSNRFRWDAPVELKPLYASMNGVGIPEHQSMDKVPSQGVYVANRWVATVSSEYQLVPNTKAVDIVLQSLETLNIRYDYSHMKTQFNGRKFHFVLALLSCSFNISDKDAIVPIVHGFNSYDTTLAFSIAIAAHRCICTNYLYIGNPMVVKIIHLNRNDIKQEGIEELLLKNLRFNSVQQKWQQWMSLKADKDFSVRGYLDFLLKNHIPEAYVKQAFNLLSNGQLKNGGMNLWRLYNFFSYIMTSPHAVQHGYTASTKYGKAIKLNLESQRNYMKLISGYTDKFVSTL